MPAVLSKGDGGTAAEKEATQEHKFKKLLMVIGPGVFSNVVSGAMLFTARQASVGKIFKSQEALASFLSRLVSMSSFFELVTNPVFGKISDAYGRRSTMFIGNIMTTVCRLLMFSFPASLWPTVMEQLVTVPLITTFFTTWRAAASDELEGEVFSRFTATVGAFAGMGILTGPLISKVIMNRYEPKYCFLIASIMSFCGLVHLACNFEETLPVDKRKPIIIGDMQPFSFLQVMKKSPTLQKLMCVSGLQSAGEGRNVNDFIALYMQKNLNWDWSMINNFVASLGVALITSGVGSKQMMARIGFANFTAFSNFSNITSFILYSLSTYNDWFMWLGLVAAIPGARKRDVVEGLIMSEGTKEGFGKGFLSASMNNWRAVVNTLGPLFFGVVYNWGQRNKRPGAIWLSVASLTFSAQCVAWTLPNSVYEQTTRETKL
jgi:MFS family permease